MDILLVRDLALEQWRSMDRYADALEHRLGGAVSAPEWRTVRGPRYAARYWAYPRALANHHPRLVHVLDHSYGHCLSAFPGTPAVVTLHDLWPVRVMGQRRGGPRAAVRNYFLRRALAGTRRADRWVAGTRFTADEAVALLGLPREHVAVAPYGVDPRFSEPVSAEDAAALRRIWGEEPGGRAVFILNVGSCEPRKNVASLLETCARLRAGGLDARLVQLGGMFSTAQRARMHALGLERVVRQEHSVDEAALRGAYHAADVLLIASTYEGFGLPVLEAMAGGLPVVTSGAGGLAEAGGDAAVTVGSSDPSRLAEAVAGVLADGPLRAQLVALGRERARTQTWEATATIVAGVYAELGVDVGATCD